MQRLESKVDSMSHLLSSTYLLNQQGKSPSLIPSEGDTPVAGDITLSPSEKTIAADTQEASARLEYFHAEMAPLFPFVVVPPSIPPYSLLSKKPMLYMAIMAVTSQGNVDQQMHLAKVFRDDAARRMMVTAEQNLGLLEGILVYLAWWVNLAL